MCLITREEGRSSNPGQRAWDTAFNAIPVEPGNEQYK